MNQIDTLRSIREKAGISLCRAARLCGVTPGRLSRVELSQQPVPGRIALGLVGILGPEVLELANLGQLVNELIRRRREAGGGPENAVTVS